MSAGLYNISAEQGATLYEPLTYALDDGSETPIDITGAVFRMQVRDTLGVLVLDYSTGDITFNITSAVDGEFDVNVTASVMASTTAGDYLYDLEMDLGGKTYRIVEGSFCIKKEQTET